MALLSSELQRNPCPVGRSHRQPQLLFPRLIVLSFQVLYLLYQTNCHIRRRIYRELVAQAHSRTSQKRYVSPIIRGTRLPALRTEDVSGGSRGESALSCPSLQQWVTCHQGLHQWVVRYPLLPHEGSRELLGGSVTLGYVSTGF
jgi:hypothetical protein